MAFTPATWDPATKGPNATLSDGNLGYYTDGYYSNSATSTSYVQGGKWYFELTATNVESGCAPQIGVANAGGSGALFRPKNTLTVVNGDVFGVSVDITSGASIGYVVITQNGASVSSQTVDPSYSASEWSAYVDDSNGASGGTPIWEANFGQTTFAYGPPSGFYAGFGVLDSPPLVTGMEADGVGTPTINYPPIVAGMQADGIGTPTGGVTRVGVTGMQAGELGFPHIISNWTGKVIGIQAGDLGIPFWAESPIVGPAPIAVVGIAADGLGAVSSSSTFFGPVDGIESEGLGTVSLTMGFAVVGMEADGIGGPGSTVWFRVAPILSTSGFGGITATRGVLVPGLSISGLGMPNGHAFSVHEVDGIAADGLGDAIASTGYPVIPFALPAGLGIPILQGSSC